MKPSDDELLSPQERRQIIARLKRAAKDGDPDAAAVLLRHYDQVRAQRAFRDYMPHLVGRECR